MDKVLDDDKTFCHKDQIRMASQAREWMNKGESVCAVDLSNATDRLPRSLFLG